MTPPGRSRRGLTGMEAALATDTRLASMFAMFNALNHGEPARGPDPVPGSGWPPWCRWPAPGPWVPRVAALVAMVAVIVGGVLLSAAVRPVVRSCLIITSARAPVTAPVSGAARAAAARAAVGRGHMPLCRAYPANK
jgi:hypothetical protein